MPVILATQEAEIRRIAVRSQPRQIVLETLISKISITKRAGGVTQSEGPEFKPQYHKKKKKNAMCSPRVWPRWWDFKHSNQPLWSYLGTFPLFRFCI
jgi:hypothetical protein